MGRSTVRPLVVAILAVPLLLLAVPAFAQYPPSQDEALSCSNVDEGETATCSAGGLQAGSEASWTATATTSGTAMPPLATIGLTLAQGGEVIASGTATADADGFITFGFDVPADASNVQVTVQGTAADGSAYVAAETFPVDEPAGAEAPAPAPDVDDGGLPSTGEMISMLLVTAVLALGIGTLAVRRGRSKATTDA